MVSVSGQAGQGRHQQRGMLQLKKEMATILNLRPSPSLWSARYIQVLRATLRAVRSLFIPKTGLAIAHSIAGWHVVPCVRPNPLPELEPMHLPRGWALLILRSRLLSFSPTARFLT